MPTIPSIQSQTRVSPTTQPQAGFRATPDQFGADVGRAVQESGAGIRQGGDKLFQYGVQKREEEIATNVQKTVLDAEAKWSSYLLQAQQDAELGAPGFKDKVVGEYDDFYNQTLGNTSSPYEKQLLDIKLLDLKNNIADRATKFEFQAREAKHKIDVNNLIMSSGNAIFDNPERFDKLYNDARLGIEVSGLPAIDKELLKNDLKQQAAASRFKNLILNNPQQALEDIKDPKWNDFLNVDQQENIIGQATREIRGRSVEAKALIKTAEDRLDAGYDIPPDELAQINATVLQSGDAATIASWQQTKDLNVFRQNIRALSPVQLETVINGALLPAAQQGGATQMEAKRVDVAQKMLSEMQTAIKNDPIAWAARTGEAVPPLDFNDSNSIQTRVATGMKISDRYNIEPTFLTQEETKMLATNLSKSNTEQRFATAKNILNSFGSNTPYVLKSLNKEDPVMANAIALLNETKGNEVVARSIIEGQKLIELDSPFTPKNAAVGTGSKPDDEFFKVVGNAFAQRPEQYSIAKRTADALYTSEAQKSGTEAFDASLYKKAINISLGGSADSGVLSKNGQTFIAPVGITQDTFNNFVRNLVPEDLVRFSMGGVAPIYSTGVVATPEEIAAEGRFVSVGNGRYRILMDDGYLLGGAPDNSYVLQVTPRDVSDVAKYGKRGK